jgi:hypothetical protein
MRSNAPTPPGRSRLLSDELRKILREPGRGNNILKVKKLLQSAFGDSNTGGKPRPRRTDSSSDSS